ncbi:hypothetical protein, partial [Micromonospora sp. WMMD736]|uniref:hypothetical protein n=1 Tax=Micromonospora sp. WMMD736 TaxID=3404112 RepID=UPI003B938C3D
MKIISQLLMSGLLGAVAFALLLFAPAGTLNYWQAWAFIAVVGISGSITSSYLLRTNPAALERRMPAVETRSAQRIIAGGVFLLWAAQLVVSALDHRFGWSAVPTAISLAGDLVIAVGLGAVALVSAQNAHAAVTV